MTDREREKERMEERKKEKSEREKSEEMFSFVSFFKVLLFDWGAIITSEEKASLAFQTISTSTATRPQRERER